MRPHGLFAGLLFTAYGLVVFFPFLASTDVSITNKWDGLTTIGLIQSFNDDLADEGLRLLAGEFYTPRSFGLVPPEVKLPITVFWRLCWAAAGSLVAPEDVLDALAFAGFVLTGLCGYFLLRYLDGPPWLTWGGAFLLMHLEPLRRIIPGHLGLGLYFMPFCAILCALRAADRKDLPAMLLFAAALAANFLYNEYYGFFGFIFCGLLFIVRSFAGHEVRAGRKELLAVLWGAFAFTALMLIFYPQTVGGRLASLVGAAPTAAGGGRDWGDFLRHSTIPFSALFSSSPVFSRAGRSVYSIGFYLPVFLVLFIALDGVLSFRRREVKRLWLNLGLLLPIAVLACFGVSPDSRVSLVWLTHKVAPMLRSADRALLYFLLGALLVHFKLSADLWRRAAAWPAGRRRAMGGLLAAAFVLVFLDVKIDRAYFPLEKLRLDRSEAYQAIGRGGYGLVVEVPFAIDDEFINYVYMYHYALHRKPMMNFWSFMEPLAGKLRSVGGTLNRMDAKTVDFIRKNGVRYVVVHKKKIQGGDEFERSGAFQVLYEDDEVLALETRGIDALDISALRAHFGDLLLFPKQFGAVAGEGPKKL